MVKIFNLHEAESKKFDARNNVMVAIQDQYTDIVDYYLTIDLGEFTLAANTIVDTNTIQVQAGHGIVVGNTLTFRSDDKITQAEVLSVNVNEITIDSLMDTVYLTGTTHKVGSQNLAVNGSVTPKTFYFSPSIQGNIDVTRVSLVISDNFAMDFTTFGGLPRLTRGCVLRMKDGYKKNIFNVKSNGEIINRAGIYNFIEKIGGGEFAFTAISTFSGTENRGVTIRLEGNTSDRIEMIIQDNLTGLSDFRVLVQGHVTAP